MKANIIDEMMGTRFVEIICYLLNQLPGKDKYRIYSNKRPTSN